MTLELETSTEIERPIDAVFDYVTAVENNEEWEPRAVESPPPDEEMDVGTTWHMVVEGLTDTAETTMECIEYDPPNRFGYTTPSGMMGGRLKTKEAIYTFSEQGDRTRVEWSGTIELNGFMRLLAPVVSRALGSDVATSLENLKRELEAPSETVAESAPATSPVDS